MKKRLLILLLCLALLLALLLPAQAKTIASAGAQNVFFYALNAEGKSVLLKVIPLSELQALAHGQADGTNYCISTTDNYPTTQYCEGRGFTVMELLDHVKSVTIVPGADGLSFTGGDTLRLMATDSYGNYTRSWTAEQLYSVKRYYFEGLYDSAHGWKTGWEVAGEDSSKFGVTLEDYYKNYKDSDPYYEDKRAVFSSGVETTVILATESYSGRTTSETLTASTEPGIAGYIRANGGTVAGCLSSVISADYALRLTLPMTEADLMAAHRTAYDNFKWIYNLRLDMENAPAIPSQGTVAEPVPTFTLEGDALTVAFACATPGASIYVGDDGAPQTLYTGPITLDVGGRDLSSDPVTLYATAVKEGWDDAGILTFKYPGMAPAFQTVYSGMTGEDLSFTAASAVTAEDWAAWTKALLFVTMKAPDTGGYATLAADRYRINDETKTVTFDGSLFTETGSYSFIFHASRYADKSLSVTVKRSAPALTAEEAYVFGEPVTLRYDGEDYGSGLSVYVTDAEGNRSLISASYLERGTAGEVTIREEYFRLASSAMSRTGAYTLELVNSRFVPSTQTVTLVLGFADVPAGSWYFPYVTELASLGVVNGMSESTFEPGGELTFGQAMRLLLVTAGYGEQERSGSHWASGYMDKAAAEGLIPAGLDPDAPITRLQFCRAAAKALSAETTLTASPFTDTEDPAVLALYEMGIINGMTPTAFEPEGSLTRAQISAIIWRIMRLEG